MNVNSIVKKNPTKINSDYCLKQMLRAMLAIYNNHTLSRNMHEIVNAICMIIHAKFIITSNHSPRSMFCIVDDKSDTGNSSITYQDVIMSSCFCHCQQLKCLMIMHCICYTSLCQHQPDLCQILLENTNQHTLLKKAKER